jgi:putative membrane protein
MKKITLALFAALALTPLAQAAPPPPGVSGLDASYLKMSAAGDTFEMRGAKLALERSTDSKLHGYARMLYRDHSKSLHETIALAKQLGVKGVKAEPTKSQTWELKEASRDKGGAFHRWYLLLEAHDHKDDISEAREERDNGMNWSIRESARSELPTLFKHLKVAERLLKA